MKNKLIIITLIINLFTAKVQAQKSKDAAIAVGAGIITGLLIANSIENVKEGFERHMLEWILENKKFNNKVEFELKLIKWEATKREELNSVSVVAFQYTEKGKEPIILLNACSHGWINDNGINFSFVQVYEIDKQYWGKIMTHYLFLSKEDDVEIDKLDLNNIETLDSKYKVINQSISNLNNIDEGGLEFYEITKGTSRVDFKKLVNSKSHIFKDFDENFKIGFHEGNLNIFLRGTRDLITLKRSFIVDLTNSLFHN